MSLLIVSAVLSLAAAATDAPPPSSDEPAQPTESQLKAAEKKADQDRVVCRKEMVVGSHRPMKKCLTKAQWQEWEDENKDKLNIQTLQDPTPDVAKSN